MTIDPPLEQPTAAAAALGDHARGPARRPIREIKAAIRARIEASGPHRRGGLRRRRGSGSPSGSREIEAAKRARRDRLAGHRLRRHRGRHRHRRGSSSTLRRRGCLVVRGHFDREQALGLGPRTSSTTSRRNAVLRELPRARRRLLRQRRLQARDLPDLLVAGRRWRPGRATGWPRVQAFLNRQWKHESDGVQWFDPDRDSLYPDRIRRRPPGADSGGLGTHLDPGTLDLWMTEAYQQAFRHLFDGTVEQYDPWDAAHRTAGPQYPGTTMCSAFRTFQGWTALSDMDHDQGVLHTVPIPEAMAYLMLRPLLADVPDDDMCGVTVNQVFPASEKWHPLLMRAPQRHPRRPGRRLRLVALRHDPQRRAGHGPAGLGQRHVHPRRPVVPAQRGVRRERPRGLPHRLQPERLPGGALRARAGRTASRPTSSTRPAAAVSDWARRRRSGYTPSGNGTPVALWQR